MSQSPRLKLRKGYYFESLDGHHSTIFLHHIFFKTPSLHRNQSQPTIHAQHRRRGRNVHNIWSGFCFFFFTFLNLSASPTGRMGLNFQLNNINASLRPPFCVCVFWGRVEASTTSVLYLCCL